MTKEPGTKKGGGSRVSRKRDPKTGLTAQQEHFVLLFVYGHEGKYLTQAGSYRLAYNCENMSDAVVCNEACKLLQNHKVTMRVAELRNSAARQSSINREHETEKLERVFEAALYGRQEIAKDENGNVIYLNPDAPEGERLPKVVFIKPNLSAAVRAREAIQRLNGLLVDPGKVSDIPPLEVRLEQYRKDPDFKRKPVSGEITRLPPLDEAD